MKEKKGKYVCGPLVSILGKESAGCGYRRGPLRGDGTSPLPCREIMKEKVCRDMIWGDALQRRSGKFAHSEPVQPLFTLRQALVQAICILPQINKW